MDPRIETVTNEWRFRSCEPGYAGLHALAEGGFSGSVAAEGATGFMVNGRLVGIAGGTIESFWSSDIAALEADEPAEALLCAMLITNGAVEAEYYTGETPIQEVHETLASGGFSGYIELSENVFSGDYFVTYYGGTSKSVALLGTEERVVSGDEAFERACDEVGIYEVKSVSIDVITIPEPEVDDSAIPESPPDDEEPADEASQTVPPDPEPEPEVETPPTDERPAQPVPTEPPETESKAVSDAPKTVESDADGRDIAALAEAARGGDAAQVAQSGGSGSSPADEWVSIPALDPANTVASEPEPEPMDPESSETMPEPDSADDGGSEPDEEVSELAAELEAANSENDRLRERIAELEARIEEFEEEQGGDDLSPIEAIDGTNLFVRYRTKGRNTLEDAVKGGAAREEIDTNLKLERHTQFESTDATVDGEPFNEFLAQSLEFRFVEWLLGELMFELRESGRASGFEALVGTLSEVDRIEFSGTVPIHKQEGGERRSEQFTFDVVFRDSMGAALLVANVHDARDPVDETPVAGLLADANAVATAKPSLTGAFFVSRSYFEPDAMETVADATGGGLLRGSSRESYVSVSRKHGFHLCLVEARDGSFHLNVPD